jgi:serine/threonine protein phosphatase PrpC
VKQESFSGRDKDPLFELREKVEVGASSLANENHPERNEDAILVDREHLLFGIFDGVGGRQAGEVASNAAREFVAKRAGEIPPAINPEDAARLLAQILTDANKEIFLMSQKPEYVGMGTTAILLKLLPSGEEIKAAVAYVGDSRLYRLSPEGKLEQITLDDGPVRDQFHDERRAREAQKKLSNVSNYRDLNFQELGLFSYRNRISQCLGQMEISPHFQVLAVKTGDVFILTSDGVHDNLTDKEIEAICNSSSESREAAIRLTANSLARSREGEERNIRAHPDDMSAIVVKIGGK